MEKAHNNLMGCLICVNPSLLSPSVSELISNRPIAAVSTYTWKAVLSKLCKYLLVPSANIPKLHSNYGQPDSLCTGCYDAVQEIATVLTKIQTLEMTIQHIVEERGKLLAANASRSSKESKDLAIWKLFRKPAIENFACGSIPSPNVRLIAAATGSAGVASSSPSKVKNPTRSPRNKAAEAPNVNATVENTLTCPCCPFQLPFGTSEDNKQSWTVAQKSLTAHFADNHLPIQRKDVMISSETGKEYFQCSLCPFQAHVTERKGFNAAQQQLALCVMSTHFISCHDQKLNEIIDAPTSARDAPVSSPLTSCVNPKKAESVATVVDISPSLSRQSRGTCICPKCDFFVSYDPSLPTGIKIKYRKNAKTSVMYHYMANHLPFKATNEPCTTTNGQQYYECSLCSFKTFIKKEYKGKSSPNFPRSQALRSMARHYIALHEVEKECPSHSIAFEPKLPLSQQCRKDCVQNAESVTESQEEEEEDATFLLRCPQCPFSCGDGSADCDGKFKELEAHYITNHIPFQEVLLHSEKEKLAKNSYIKTNNYKCSKCSFTCEVIFEDQEEGKRLGLPTNSETESLRDLAEHYLMAHEDLATGSQEHSEDELEKDGENPEQEEDTTAGAIEVYDFVKHEPESETDGEDNYEGVLNEGTEVDEPTDIKKTNVLSQPFDVPHEPSPSPENLESEPEETDWSDKDWEPDESNDSDSSDPDFNPHIGTTYPSTAQKNLHNQDQTSRKRKRSTLDDDCDEGLKKKAHPIANSSCNAASSMERRSFRCLHSSGCSFEAEIKSLTPNSKQKRNALWRLATHNIRTHDFPNSSKTSHPCLTESGGRSFYQCPRCSFQEPVLRQRNGNFRFMMHFFSHLGHKFRASLDSGKEDPRIKTKEGFVAVKKVNCPRSPECQFVVEVDPTWKLRYASDAAGRMKKRMERHYKISHPGEKVPELSYYVIRQSDEDASLVKNTEVQVQNEAGEGTGQKSSGEKNVTYGEPVQQNADQPTTSECQEKSWSDEDWLDDDLEESYVNPPNASEQMAPPYVIKKSSLRRRMNTLRRSMSLSVKSQFKPDSLAQLEGLVEGQDYYRCQHPAGCPFTAQVYLNPSIPESRNKRKNAILGALWRIGSHTIRVHDFPRSKRYPHPCLNKNDEGQSYLKCPRCDYRSDVFDNQSSRGRAKNQFSYHFLTHLNVTHLHASKAVDVNKRLIPRKKVPCPLCSEFAVEVNRTWDCRDASDVVVRMRRRMERHIRSEHNKGSAYPAVMSEINYWRGEKDDDEAETTECASKSGLTETVTTSELDNVSNPSVSSNPSAESEQDRGNTSHLVRKSGRKRKLKYAEEEEESNNSEKPEDPQETAGEPQESLDGLVEGQDYYRCLHTGGGGCSFIAKIYANPSLPEGRNKRKNAKLSALWRVGNHTIRTHDFPSSKKYPHPCLQTKDGKLGFQCPRCDFRANMEARGERYRCRAKSQFMYHFLTHLGSAEADTQEDETNPNETAKSVPLRRIPCPLCSEFVVEVNPIWDCRDGRDVVKRLKTRMERHLKTVHSDKDVPHINYYSKISNVDSHEVDKD